MTKKMADKGVFIDFAELLKKVEQKKSIKMENDTLRSRRKTLSKKICKEMKSGNPIVDLQDEVRFVNEKLKSNELVINELDHFINTILLDLPNPPADGVAPGGKENNEVIKIHGIKPEFNFIPKSHIELAESLDLIDYKRGVKLSGSGYWVYTRIGAMLEWALLNYFIEAHLADGYEMLLLPHILNQECGFVAGQFPKFYDEVYYLDDSKEKFILPTAETALVNLHRDEILSGDQLPIKYTAYSACFRAEAGSAGRDTRGLIRQHQFNKVELVKFVKPETSYDELEKLTNDAEKLLQKLGLAYRVVCLSTGDLGFSSAKTYDIEVWMPSYGRYVEISSCSNFEDYQARRANIKYKETPKDKAQFVHTLNGSGLAVGRTVAAILENYQNEDGTVTVPEVLVPYMGTDEISK